MKKIFMFLLLGILPPLLALSQKDYDFKEWYVLQKEKPSSVTEREASWIIDNDTFLIKEEEQDSYEDVQVFPYPIDITITNGKKIFLTKIKDQKQWAQGSIILKRGLPSLNKRVLIISVFFFLIGIICSLLEKDTWPLSLRDEFSGKISGRMLWQYIRFGFILTTPLMLCWLLSLEIKGSSFLSLCSMFVQKTLFVYLSLFLGLFLGEILYRIRLLDKKTTFA